MTLKIQGIIPHSFQGRTLPGYGVFKEKEGLAVGHPTESSKVAGPIELAKLA